MRENALKHWHGAIQTPYAVETQTTCGRPLARRKAIIHGRIIWSFMVQSSFLGSVIFLQREGLVKDCYASFREYKKFGCFKNW